MEKKLKFIWWGVLVILIVLAGWKFFLPHGSKSYIEKAPTNREIVVYVTGAVEKTGLVHLPLNARLDDALKQAKPLPEANLDVLNPAEKLKDGQKITVSFKPVQNSTASLGAGNSPGSSNISLQAANTSAQTANTATQAGILPNPTPRSSDAILSPGVSALGSGKVNINTAGPAELDKLPNIGPALAERIIQYRTEHGPFARPEDLMNVSGIGAKTYEKMAPYVTVGP